MRRDSLYYRLFQQLPSLFFQFVSEAPANTNQYHFDSVAVKEAKFEIDGVFLPPDTGTPGVVYFCEVQFQKDELLYERLFGESLLYFYRNRARFSDWQAVVIYPKRSTEQGDVYPCRSLLQGGQTHIVYLDELGEPNQLPIEVALMLLTIAKKRQAPDAAKVLLARAEQEAIEENKKQAIIDLVVTIVSYQFTKLKRAEVEAMLDIRFQETQVYKDIKQEGREEGRTEEALNFVLRLLRRQLGKELPSRVRSQVTRLSLSALEQLGEDLLDFGSIADLKAWLVAQQEE